MEGTTTLQQNTTVGCEVRITGSNVCPADSVDPSITIINGDLILEGTPHFYGLVYVIGNLELSGNSTFHGAMISTGGLQNGTGGSMDIWYNSDLLEWVRFNGFLASAPGSWHDW